MTKEFALLLKEWNTAFKFGNRVFCCSVHSNLQRGIRKAKADYKRMIDDHLENNNTRQVWQAVQHRTNYKDSCGKIEGNSTLAKELNVFFACFEELQECISLHSIVSSNTISTLVMEENVVRHTLKFMNQKRLLTLMVSMGTCLSTCCDSHKNL